ncbi:MAG: hypothetical protein E7254_10265 [Lachnospiraceae bacterium]|nr:hypothetical protein [Lachnospiraceae bacterium]
MINPTAIFKLKAAWERFSSNHPKFVPFLNAVASKGVVEGSVIEISVTSPEGETIATNVKITQSDLELFEEMKALSK